MRYVIHPCTGCDDHTPHKILGNSEEGSRIVQCDKCGRTDQREQARRLKNPERQPWPYYNESAGVTFESESHEQKHVKENKLEPL